MNTGLWDRQAALFLSCLSWPPLGPDMGLLVRGGRGSCRVWQEEGKFWCLMPVPVPHPAGRRATSQCLTTTSKRAVWTSVRCTWPMSGRPAVPTASLLRRPCFPAGPRRGPSCLPTHPGGPSSPIAQPTSMPSPGLCSIHTPPKTFISNLWILPLPHVKWT